MLKILLVEDEVINYKLIKHIFDLENNFDVEIEHVNNAEEALDSLGKGNEYHIILTDINLPVISGIELANKVRKNEKYNDIFIIALTAYSRNDFESLLKENHCENIFYQVVFKPVDTKLLLNICKAINIIKKI